MPALLLQSEAGGMLANGFTVLCLLSSGSGVERSSGSLPGRPNVVSGVAGTCPRATPVSRRSAVGMAHKRSIRLQCMMSSPTVSLLLFQPICSDSIRAPWHFVDAHAYAITAEADRKGRGCSCRSHGRSCRSNDDPCAADAGDLQRGLSHTSQGRFTMHGSV